jgi:hypothetical protein
MNKKIALEIRYSRRQKEFYVCEFSVFEFVRLQWLHVTTILRQLL